MTLTVEVNVSVDDVKKKGCDYEGKFHFQQISPLDEIYVKKNGDIKADLANEEVDVVLNWVSNAVEIDGQLYSAHFVQPLNENVWVLPGENSNPGKGDKAPSSGNHEITVPDGPGDTKLTIKDKNTPSLPNKKFKYALAVEIEIDGGQLLIEDPRIINMSGNPLMGPKSKSGTKKAPPPGTNAGN